MRLFSRWQTKKVNDKEHVLKNALMDGMRIL